MGVDYALLIVWVALAYAMVLPVVSFRAIGGRRKTTQLSWCSYCDKEIDGEECDCGAEPAQIRAHLVLKVETFVYLLILGILQAALCRRFMATGSEDGFGIETVALFLPGLIICAYGIVNTAGHTLEMVDRISTGLSSLFAEYVPDSARGGFSPWKLLREVRTSAAVLGGAALIILRIFAA